MAKKKNWVLIVLGIVIFVVIVGVALIGGFAYYMYRQMDVTTETAGRLDEEFAKVRERFQGQTPYVEMSDVEHGEGKVHRELEKAERTPLTRLRVVVYDPSEKKLVRLAIPFWLLRLSGNKPINLRSGGSGFDPGVRLTITSEDLERRGPGLVLDTEGRRGERVIIWSE